MLAKLVSIGGRKYLNNATVLADVFDFVRPITIRVTKV